VSIGVTPAGAYTLETLKWAVERGVLTGFTDGRLNPKGTAARAQTAQMLMRYIAE